MNTSKFCITILQVVTLSLIVACSNTEEPDGKNVINRTTDKIAHDAVSTVKRPINKAKNVAVLSNDRTREIQDAAKQK